MSRSSAAANKMKPTPSASKSGKRIRKDADTRRAEIIKTGYELLAADGYAAFSLREVAARCQIRLATVQHHFKDRATLLEALVDFAVADIVTTFNRFSSMAHATPAERLRHFMMQLLTQNNNRNTAGFFVEFWAMAHRDPAAARSLERSQAHGIHIISALISAARPDIPPRRASELGTVLMAAADGLMLSVGYGKKPSAALGKDPLPGLVDRLMELALL